MRILESKPDEEEANLGGGGHMKSYEILMRLEKLCSEHIRVHILEI